MQMLIYELGTELPAIHPGILILTKFKRWTAINQSTYPPSVQKAQTDFSDIMLLADWLQREASTMAFKTYHAQRPEALDQAVKDAMAYLETEEMADERARLMKIIAPNDRLRLGLLV
jgi:cytochrome c1